MSIESRTNLSHAPGRYWAEDSRALCADTGSSHHSPQCIAQWAPIGWVPGCVTCERLMADPGRGSSAWWQVTQVHVTGGKHYGPNYAEIAP